MTLALISTMFRDAAQRGVAIGVSAMCFMVGGSVGALVGGVMLANFWWGSVFLLNVPVLAVLLLAGPVVLPESRASEAGRVDLPSVAMSLAAILPVIYAIKGFARDGIGTVPVVTVAAGLVVGAIFVRRQQRLADPLLDLRLLANRSLAASVVTMLLALMALGGVLLYFVQYLQLSRG